jgi:mannose-6-phosphate isomerase
MIYDRRDWDGKMRDLQVDSSIAVVTPLSGSGNKPIIKIKDGLKISTFVQSNYFTVIKWN